MKKFFRKQLPLFIMASLTLGLAPFNPPHVWGKLQWISGGGAFSGSQPMQLMDWLDLLMHGTPWVLLIISVTIVLSDKIRKTRSGTQP